MASETVSARITIMASVEDIFAVLVDPTKHAAIDGTGWVRDPVDREPLSASGQVFRMAMYHPRHPDGSYETANLVEVFDPPHAVSWKPGYDPGDGVLRFGGWTWRYDLTRVGSAETEVILSYGWSSVPEEVRRTGPKFPPFPPGHLDNSLAHLTNLVVT